MAMEMNHAPTAAQHLPDQSSRPYEGKLEVVAGGEAVAVLPAGDQRSTLRQDLTTVPIEGIDPCQVVVATRAKERNHLVAAFIESARTYLSGITT